MNRRTLFRNLLIWAATFTSWFLWESTIRLYLGNLDWDLPSVYFSTFVNVLYGAAWGVALGAVHTFVLLVASKIPSRLSLFLNYPFRFAVASLLVVPVLFSYRDYSVHHQIPLLFRWLTAIPLLLLLYAGIYAFLHLFEKLVRRWVRGLAWVTLAFSLMLLLFVGVFALYRGGRIVENAKGPIRYIVLISIDTLRYDYVGAYGVEPVSTPVMDQAASEGALFRYAISSIPQTGPSHTSMLTGQEPLYHGVHYNDQPLPYDSSMTITMRLRNAGFQTGGFISGIPLKNKNSGLQKGFQRYDDLLASDDIFSGSFYGRLWRILPFRTLALRRNAVTVTEPALAWLKTNVNSPFFLFLHYYDPHFPYDHKPTTGSKHNPWHVTALPEDLPEQKRLYARQVENVDAQIGRVIQILREEGIYDETLLIITSDHGESLGEHDYYYAHDKYVYDQLLRVPMLLRCPKLIEPGVVVGQQVAVLDVAQTILNAAGLEPGEGVGGQDLIALKTINPDTRKREILSHNFTSGVHSIRTQTHKLIRNDHKLEEKYELYDLWNNPAETVNLYALEPNLAIALKGRMNNLFQSLERFKNEWSVKELTPEQLEELQSLGYFN